MGVKSEDCFNVKTECVLEHICYKYASMVMSGLIEAIDYFAGSQGPKVLRRILAKEIPFQLMKELGLDEEALKSFSKEEIVEALPKMIEAKGGPRISIEFLDGERIRFTLNECHFMPYSKSKGFCNVTAGLMLGFAQMLTGKPMDIEQIRTIASGADRCEFIAKPKF